MEEQATFDSVTNKYIVYMENLLFNTLCRWSTLCRS